MINYINSKRKRKTDMMKLGNLTRIFYLILTSWILYVSSWGQNQNLFFSKEQSTGNSLIRVDENPKLNQAEKRFPCHFINNVSKEFEILANYGRQPQDGDSKKSHDKYSISIVTIISPTNSMLKRIKQMYQRWNGPISISVFIKDKTLKQKIIQKLQQYQDENSHIFQSRLSFHLVTDLKTGRGENVNMFPKNLLRNVAMQNTDANYALLLDADLLPSIGAYENLRRHLKEIDEEEATSKSRKKINKHAIVIPAFEKSPLDKFENFEVKTKEELLEMKKIDPEAVLPFLLKSKLSAHQNTRSIKWYQSKHRYSVPYKEDYEPYVLVRTDADLPPFWEHFVGFGRNKLEWIEELFVAGYKFTVVPDVFVLHLWHEKYGLRKIRPYIADEYALRFQEYLKHIYGRALRSSSSLKHWQIQVNGNWNFLSDAKEQFTSGYTADQLAEISNDRETEFKECLRLLNM